MLLFSADRVHMTTQMYRDASGMRRLVTSGDSSLARQLTQWTRETSPGFQQDRRQLTSNRVIMSRSQQVANLASIPDVDARVLDIVQYPLSLKTKYFFSERVAVDFTYGSAKELASAPLTHLDYTLVLPGRITSASPANARKSGNTCQWTLAADMSNVEISATAEAWRWDLIAVLLYLGVYFAYRLAGFVITRARYKPRKI
jgi:hypothetical protein